MKPRNTDRETKIRIGGGHLYCARCFYDVRSIGKGRCPECGTELDPEDCYTVTLDPPSERQQSIDHLVEPPLNAIQPFIGYGLIFFYFVLPVLVLLSTYLQGCFGE